MHIGTVIIFKRSAKRVQCFAFSCDCNSSAWLCIYDGKPLGDVERLKARRSSAQWWASHSSWGVIEGSGLVVNKFGRPLQNLLVALLSFSFRGGWKRGSGSPGYRVFLALQKRGTMPIALLELSVFQSNTYRTIATGSVLTKFPLLQCHAADHSHGDHFVVMAIAIISTDETLQIKEKSL